MDIDECDIEDRSPENFNCENNIDAFACIPLSGFEAVTDAHGELSKKSTIVPIFSNLETVATMNVQLCRGTVLLL